MSGGHGKSDAPPPGTLRVWRKNAAASRDPEADYLAPGVTYAAADLGLTPGGEIIVYVEATKAAAGVLPVTVAAAVTGERWSGTLKDTMHVTPLGVTLDLEESVGLVNDFDADADGLEDFFDGYNLFGGEVAADDASDPSTFLPLRVGMPDVDLSRAKVTFTYAASDPAGVESSAQGYMLAPGDLRVWTKKGTDPRDGESVINDGHFVPTDPFAATKLFRRGEERTLQVELVRVSEAADDREIAVSLDVDGDGSPESTARVSLTAARVELIAYDYDGSHGVVRQFVPSDLGHEPDPFTHGRFKSYVIRVTDPREGEVTALRVYGQTLPLLPAGGGVYETPEFVVRESGGPAGWVPDGMAVLRLDGPTADLEYNPIWRWGKSRVRMDNLPPGAEVLGPIIAEEVDILRSTNWRPENPSDSGAFGEVVHERTSAKVVGKPGWLVDVYVRETADGNHIIESVGTRPTVIDGTTQVDLLHVDNGYSPAAGQVLDRTKVKGLIDIKTSLKNGFNDI